MQFTNNIFQGRICVSPAEAGRAVFGWAAQTCRNRVAAGTFPFPLFELAGKKVVRLVDVAAALNLTDRCADVVASPASAVRRGKPSNVEKAQAERLGLSVPQFRRSEVRP